MLLGSLIHHTIKTLLYNNELILDIKLEQYKKKKNLLSFQNLTDKTEVLENHRPFRLIGLETMKLFNLHNLHERNKNFDICSQNKFKHFNKT